MPREDALEYESTCTYAKEHTYFCKIVKMVFRAIRCQAHRCSGAVWRASNEGGGSSKGVWTLFILVIMNYWGHTQGEIANAKNQWGDVDKLGKRRAAVNTCAAGPSPQQGMLLHLPPLRAGCLPFGRTMAYNIYAKCNCRPAQNASRARSFIKVGMQHTCRRSGKGVQIHIAKIQWCP